MALEDLTLALFTACNAIRVFAYVPQIYRAATDKNGASAISYTTWTLFLIANLSTVIYALVNRADWSLAAWFAVQRLVLRRDPRGGPFQSAPPPQPCC